LSKREPVSEEDAALFRAAAGEVRALDEERAPHYRRRAQPRRRSGPREPALAAGGQAPAESIRAPERDGEQLFVRAGLQQKHVRRLRRGQIPMDAEVDLHGMRMREAGTLLARFIADCRARGQRCVRIIHGKGLGSRGGQAVLKWEVDRWLRENPAVMAFCSAQPRDGGTGAVYVLLRA
jgi:DNA-nicking Smr family endonuclease